MSMQPPAAPAPAFRLALTFASGILLGRATDAPLVACAALTLLLTCALLASGPPGGKRRILAALVLLSSGSLRQAMDSARQMELPDPADAAPVVVTGEVTGFPVIRPLWTTFTLETDSCKVLCATQTQSAWRSTPMRLSVFVPSGKTGVPFDVSTGMRLRASGLLSAPRRERNPGEFNPRSRARETGIDGELTTWGGGACTVLDSARGSSLLARWISPVRKGLREKVLSRIEGPEGEFLIDLLVGDRSGIPGETREAFIDAGVAHVFAVSGFRVLVVRKMTAALLTLARLPLRVRTCAEIPVLLFYMVLAGGEPAVVRATVMAILFILAQAAGRRSGGRNALGAAALLILGLDSRQLFDAGFQLSFAGVLAIEECMGAVRPLIASLAGVRGFGPLLASVARSAAISLIVSLGTLPVSASIFGRVSLIGLLTNIAVVPATGLAMVLGTLSLIAGPVIPFAGDAYAAATVLILRWTTGFSLAAASVPLAALPTPRFGIWEAITWYAGITVMIRWNEKRTAAKALALFLTCLQVSLSLPPDAAFARTRGMVRLSAIDVGQGDAFLLEFPGGSTMLVDAGPATAFSDAGRTRVVPFLERKGIGGLDLLVLTHPDADHAGGASRIIRTIDVRRVVEGSRGATEAWRSYTEAASACGTPRYPGARGDLISHPFPARLYILWPPGVPEPGIGRTEGAPNDASVVFRLVYGEVSILFAGDAERRAEHALVRSSGRFLRSRILKVAHHGSAGSSSEEFLAAVHPDLALLAVGLRNRFGHPDRAMLRRLTARGTVVARTDREGALIFETDGRSIRRVDWRGGDP